jgi:replication-associated recombination protein RarA
MTLPSLWKPRSVEDFIGPAQEIAEELRAMVDNAVASSYAPVKILLNGNPGIGKSALAEFLLGLMNAHPKWSTHKYNGTEVKLEQVSELSQRCAYKDMYSDYRVFWIEEADKIPSAAQVRFLTLLDDLPTGNAVLCTSNCSVDQFEERFQTRFQIFEVEPPTIQQVAALLGRWLPDRRQAFDIANATRGNVRAALLDATAALQKTQSEARRKSPIVDAPALLPQ